MNNPGGDQIFKHTIPVGGGIEPDSAVDHVNGVKKIACFLPRDRDRVCGCTGLSWGELVAEVKGVLILINDPLCLGHQDGKLVVGVGRSDVVHRAFATGTGVDDLHCGRSGLGADGADVRTHVGDFTYPHLPS